MPRITKISPYFSKNTHLALDVKIPANCQGQQKKTTLGRMVFIIMRFKLEDTLFHHSFCYLEETSDVSTCNEVVAEAVFFSSFSSVVVDGLHDATETGVNFFFAPEETFAVLCHFECGYTYATSVNSLRWSHDDALGLDVFHCIVGGRHVSNFDVVLRIVSNNLFSLFHVNIVLGSGWHIDVSLNAPWLFAWEEFNTKLVSVVLNLVTAGSTHFEQVSNLFFGYDTIWIVDVAVWTGKGDNLSASFSHLGANAPSNVTETGNCYGLAFESVIIVLSNSICKVNSTETSSFWTDEGTTVAHALTGKYAVFESATDTTILAIEVTNDSAVYTDVTSWNVNVWADVAIKFGHEGLAETLDFAIALATWVEVRTTLTTADRKTSKSVLEDLFET